MPVLDLGIELKEFGLRTPGACLAFQRLRAVLLWPDDAVKRAEWEVVTALQGVASWRPTDEKSTDWLASTFERAGGHAALSVASSRGELEKDATRRRGWLNLTCVVFEIMLARPNVGLRHIAKALSRAAEDGCRLSIGPTSEAQIRRVWKQFASVAPLAAAARRFSLHGKDLGEFISEWLQLTAEFTRRGIAAGRLDEARTWRICPSPTGGMADVPPMVLPDPLLGWLDASNYALDHR